MDCFVIDKKLSSFAQPTRRAVLGSGQRRREPKPQTPRVRCAKMGISARTDRPTLMRSERLMPASCTRLAPGVSGQGPQDPRRETQSACLVHPAAFARSRQPPRRPRKSKTCVWRMAAARLANGQRPWAQLSATPHARLVLLGGQGLWHRATRPLSRRKPLVRRVPVSASTPTSVV